MTANARELQRSDWLDLARKLDWELSYVDEHEAFPDVMSGTPWLPRAEWASWDEPYRTSYSEYVIGQAAKDASVHAARDLVGGSEDVNRLDRSWLSVVKLHSATVALAEFAAVIGNLRAARFGRDSAWRTTSLLCALDEIRHTQIPLLVMHDLVAADPQFDWTHKFYHSNEWVAVASRHLVDELILTSNAIELAIGTNFVFETGFTNLQFVGLASMAHRTGDRLFEKMVQSIQTDEARHAQVGRPVLEMVMKHDPEYAQYLVDKWFWRSWIFVAIVTGFAMDYLTPLRHRTGSFKEFMEEWIVDQFLRSLADVGLAKPWYWDQFVKAMGIYHHMVYASAYTYRATMWFDFAMPSPDERAWLREKYPAWDEIDPIWDRITDRWRAAAPGAEWFTHGVTAVGFCDTCQVVLCGGTPGHNTASSLVLGDRKYMFCSEPCRWIFQRESQRYAKHKNIVQRILTGEAPGNLVELVQRYFDLSPADWGKDVTRGSYPWLARQEAR